MNALRIWKIRAYFTKRPPLAAAVRLAAVAGCAALAVALSLSPDSLAGKIAFQGDQRLAIEERVSAIGLSTLGTAYLDDTEGEGDWDMSASVADMSYTSMSGVQRFGEALAPVRGSGDNPDGALYPIRKGVEQLTGFLLFPILVVALVHAMITGGGAPDAKIARVGIKFLTVLLLLWAYPLWDRIIYHGIALPTANMLSSGSMVAGAMQGVSSWRNDSGDYPTFNFEEDIAAMEAEPGGEFSPTRELSHYYNTDLACAQEMGSDAVGEDDAARECFGAHVPGSRSAMHTNSLTGIMVGEEDVRKSTVYRVAGAAALTALWVTVPVAAVAVTGGIAAWSVLRDGLPPNPLAHLRDWLSSTMSGMMLSLFHLAASVALWFAWVGTVVARVFSFTLAPVAIAWSLFPSARTDSAALKWFTGHAKICMMPVGLSFALLIFYMVQVAIFTTPVLANGMVGVALKLALMIGLVFVMFKGAFLTNMIAGDVTAAASDIGDAARTKTIQIAGTAAVGLAGGGTLAAGALASKAGALKAGAGALKTGSAVGKAGNAAKAASALGRANKAGSGLADKFNYGASGGGDGFFTKATGAARASLSNTVKVAKWGWEHRVTESDVQAGPGTVMRKAVVDPIRDVREEMRKGMQDTQRNRVARPDESALRSLAGLSAQREHMEDVLDAHGIRQGRARPGERVAPVVEGVPIAGATPEAQHKASVIGTILVDRLVADGNTLDINASVDEKGGLRAHSLSGESVASLTDLIESDPEFRRLVYSEAKAIYGDDIPTMAGHDGPVLDVRELVRTSDIFASGVTAASHVSETRAFELGRREIASHLAGTQFDSVADRAVRDAPVEVMEMREGEDGASYGARMKERGKQSVRMAWYIQASASERQEMNLPASGGEDVAARDIGLDIKVDEWSAEGSYSSVNAQVRDALGKALAAQNSAHVEMTGRSASHGGDSYGIDTDILIVEGREHYHAQPGGTLFNRVLEEHPEYKNNHAKAYAAAMAEAKRDSRVPTQNNGEDDDAYLKRIKPRLHEIMFLSDETLRGR